MDINSTLASEPVIMGITSMVNTVKVLVGGVFGFYLIMSIWRFYTYKKNRAFFKKLRRDVVKMTHAMDDMRNELRKMQGKRPTKSRKIPEKKSFKKKVKKWISKKRLSRSSKRT